MPTEIDILGRSCAVVRHGKPIGNCLDPISFECVDFQRLSQIIAFREAEITNLPRTQTEKGTALAGCIGGQRDGVTRKPCYLSVLSLTKRTIPWKTKMNQEEDYVSVGEPFFQARVEGPRHHQHEGILRYVQQALEDIRWTIDKTECDDSLL